MKIFFSFHTIIDDNEDSECVVLSYFQKIIYLEPLVVIWSFFHESKRKIMNFNEKKYATHVYPKYECILCNQFQVIISLTIWNVKKKNVPGLKTVTFVKLRGPKKTRF